MSDTILALAPEDAKGSNAERSYTLNLNNPDYMASIYKYRQLTQQAGNTSFTPSGSTVDTRFTIPGNSAWNLARSYITFDSTLTAGTQGAAVSGQAVYHVDSFPIEQIQLLGSNGALLCDLQSVQIYSKLMNLLTTSKEEYESRGSLSVYETQTSGPIPQAIGLNPVRLYRAAVRNNGEVVASLPTDAYILESGAVSAVVPTNASGTDLYYGSPIQHLACSGASPNGTAINAFMRWRINLKTFVGSILALDKSIFFGENLTLLIRWKPLSAWGFAATATTLAVPVAPNNTLTLTSIANFYLYMAEEVQEANKRSLMQSYEEGYSMLIPWTITKQITTPAAGTNSIETSISPNFGYCLKRAVTAVVSSANDLRYAANLFNVVTAAAGTGGKYSDVQSYLNSKPIQDQKLVVFNSDPWNYLYEFIKDSPLGMSQRTYDENSVWVDNFSDCNRSVDIPAMDFKDSGLNLYSDVNGAIPVNYQVRYTTVPANVLFVQYLTFLQVLKISKAGLQMATK